MIFSDKKVLRFLSPLSFLSYAFDQSFAMSITRNSPEFRRFIPEFYTTQEENRMTDKWVIANLLACRRRYLLWCELRYVEKRLFRLLETTSNEDAIKGFIKEFVYGCGIQQLSDDFVSAAFQLLCIIDAKVSLFILLIDCLQNSTEMILQHRCDIVTHAINHGCVDILRLLIDRFDVRPEHIDKKVLMNAYELGGYVGVYNLVIERFGYFSDELITTYHPEIPFISYGVKPCSYMEQCWIDMLVRINDRLSDDLIVWQPVKSALCGVIVARAATGWLRCG